MLAKGLEANGRPVCFVFAGETLAADGSNIFLDADLLRASVNYLQVRAGYAYPLFYNTLFRVLRETLTEAWLDAKANGRGYCPTDGTRQGVVVRSRSDLATIPPVWPKLWRRLEEYFRRRDANGQFPADISNFLAFLRRSGERADELPTFEQKSIEHFFDVVGDTVSMRTDPENLRVVSVI